MARDGMARWSLTVASREAGLTGHRNVTSRPVRFPKQFAGARRPTAQRSRRCGVMETWPRFSTAFWASSPRSHVTNERADSGDFWPR